VRRGLPHLIEDYSVTEDVLTRTAPFLTLVVFVEVFLSFGDRWKGMGQALAFVGGLALVGGGFALVNRLRGRPRRATSAARVIRFALGSGRIHPSVRRAT